MRGVPLRRHSGGGSTLLPAVKVGRARTSPKRSIAAAILRRGHRSEQTLLQEQRPDIRSTPPVDPVGREEVGKNLTELRLNRRARRLAAHGSARASGSNEALTFLEVNSVRSGTANAYDKSVKEFSEWMENAGVQAKSVEELDAAGCEYLEHMYFEGYNHDVGDRLMSSLLYCSLALTALGKAALPRMQRCLRGFRRLAPGMSRAPLPYVAVVAMVAAAFFLREPKFGIALLVQFIGYLRPHELLGLTGQHIVPPTKSEPNKWGILIAPEELAVRSKTQQFDESVLLDWTWLPALGSWLKRLADSSEGKQTLFGYDHRSYTATFQRLAEVTGVSELRPHPYSVRHGGASHDYLGKRRSLDEVRLRGRWRSEESVRRYVKASRAMKEEAALPEATQQYGQEYAERLDDVLSERLRPSAPPRLTGPVLHGVKRKILT